MASQTCTVPSKLAAAMREPSGDHRAAKFRYCPSCIYRTCPVIASQTCTVLSPKSPPETIDLPSGDQSTLRTKRRCPRKTTLSSPLKASHTHTVPPVSPETTRRPSGDQATESRLEE